MGKFLSQVGDYTLYLSKKLIRGENISDEERENLHSMSQTASSLSESVGVVKNEYDKEGAWSGRIFERHRHERYFDLRRRSS